MTTLLGIIGFVVTCVALYYFWRKIHLEVFGRWLNL